MKEHTVTDSDDGIRLDRWFKRHYAGFPHAMLEKQLRKGLIRVDGKKAKTSDRIEAGQVIRLPETELKEQPKTKKKYVLSEHEAAEIKKWVLYKDENVIVLNKPYGLAVQGGTNINKSVDDMLDGLMFGKEERPKLTHRLDRDTSGVLVIARSAKAAAGLMKAFSGKTLQKTYWALVNGSPLPPVGTIDLPLLKATWGDSLQEKIGVDESGKYAVTEYRVLDSLVRKFALMELKPLTGRTHQLRVHMEAIGCPIVGDHKYSGSTTAAKELGVENILHLHARRIVIPNFMGKTIDVSAPLPSHMMKSFKALGLDVPKK